MSLVLPFPSATFASAAARRVANSVAAMDFYFPGWAAKIDLDTFDIHSLTYCVLGQGTEDGYEVEVYKVRQEVREATDLRFSSFADDPFSFHTAQEEWERVIRNRQDNGVLAPENALDTFKRAAAMLRQQGFTVEATVTEPPVEPVVVVI